MFRLCVTRLEIVIPIHQRRSSMCAITCPVVEQQKKSGQNVQQYYKCIRKAVKKILQCVVIKKQSRRYPNYISEKYVDILYAYA